MCVCVKTQSRVRLSLTPWAAARQASLSMAFPKQEYWGGLPFPLQGIFPIQGPNWHLLHWQVDLCHRATREARLLPD